MKKRNVMSATGAGLLFISVNLWAFALICISDSKIAFYVLFFLGLLCGIVGGILMLYCYFVWDKTIKEISQ